MCTAARRRIRVRPRRLVPARGFTLLELMIVLAILALLLGLAWPALRRPLARSDVQQAARKLVGDLARARVAAIESGQIVAWRWEVGGQRYVVELAELARQRTTADDPLTQPENATQEQSSETEFAVGFIAQLEGDVLFGDPSLVEEDETPQGPALQALLRTSRDETEAVETRVELAHSEPALSEPVFFYPTGRAENAEVVLQGPDDYRITVRLRGLTGAAQLGPLISPARTDSMGDRPATPSQRDEAPLEPARPREATTRREPMP